MRASAELTAWLADTSRQMESLRRIDDFAHDAARRPLFADLKRALQDLPEKTQANVRPLVEDFLGRDEELQRLFDDLIAACAADPYFRPPFPRVHSDLTAGLVLFEDPAVLIAINAMDVHALAQKRLNPEAGTSLTFTGVPTLLKFLRGGDATLTIWEAPEIKGGFDAAHGGQCRIKERLRIADGDTLLIDGRRESFVVDHARSDIVYIHAGLRPEEAPVFVEYDSATHEYVGAASTDEAASRMQMMITLLRMMDRQDALPLFEEVLKSPHFFTRWHVMREFLALDADAALPHLKRLAASDPHPDVRAAARQTLERFFPEEADEEKEAPCPA